MAQSSAVSAELEVASLRQGIAQRARARSPGPRLHEVRDLRIAGLRARLYRPTTEPTPLVVYLHGGGSTVGSIESHDPACRRPADGSGAALLALDYRLAPEHRWPASVDDTVAVLGWLALVPPELGPAPSAVAVAGDSAGGILAALACLRLRDEQPEALADLQVLLYANADLAGDHPSMREKAIGWGLDPDTVRFLHSQWVPEESRWSDLTVSPLHAPDLEGLPPAVIDRRARRVTR